MKQKNIEKIFPFIHKDWVLCSKVLGIKFEELRLSDKALFTRNFNGERRLLFREFAVIAEYKNISTDELYERVITYDDDSEWANILRKSPVGDIESIYTNVDKLLAKKIKKDTQIKDVTRFFITTFKTIDIKWVPLNKLKSVIKFVNKL